ncbi:translation initiation factor IF-2-like [Rhinolophus ferrumequinum]|uniref:translation initiation factor IF-2-like n=1 Tax=Rhinolophus ferrumequinum TaxID=59479 RepID=UPI00140F63F4|nr:translation initiation factor IF-2-like [Rhinolophus ferrumequinum]XP_032981125.1 translation initiation factor IF-2-like [Rhinolophus ferrumequinum]
MFPCKDPPPRPPDWLWVTGVGQGSGKGYRRAGWLAARQPRSGLLAEPPRALGREAPQRRQFPPGRGSQASPEPQGLASPSHPGDPRGAADAPAGLALPGPRSLLAPAVVGLRASASPAPPGEAWRSLGGAHYPLRTVPLLRTPSHLVAAHPAATSLPALTRSPPAADSAVPHGHELLPASRSGPALAAPQPEPRSPHPLPARRTPSSEGHPSSARPSSALVAPHLLPADTGSGRDWRPAPAAPPPRPAPRPGPVPVPPTQFLSPPRWVVSRSSTAVAEGALGPPSRRSDWLLRHLAIAQHGSAERRASAVLSGGL